MLYTPVEKGGGGKIVIISILVLALALPAFSADGDFYSSSPAEGEFSDDGEVISDNSVEAGSITVETEGVLPPTGERVEINSGGTQGNVYGISNCRAIDLNDRGDEADFYDGYCEFERGADGKYLYDVNYSITAQAGLDTAREECDKITSSVSARPYVDDGPPGEKAVAGDQNRPYESTRDDFGNPEDTDVGGDPNERYVGPSNGISGDTSDVADLIREGNPFAGGYDDCDVDDSDPRPSRKSYTENFRSKGEIQLGSQPQTDDNLAWYTDPGSPTERFFMYFPEGIYWDEDGWEELVPSFNIEDAEIVYITPAGNSYLNIDGKFFSGDSYSNNDEYTTKLSEASDQWQNTSKTIELSFPEMTDRPAGGTGEVVVEGEYYAGSPSGVNPESYRWVLDSNNSKVLTSHENLNTDSNYGYRMFRNRFDFRNTDLESGTYKLQVKSDADYDVQFKQRDFEVKRDSYIAYKDSRTFNPEFKIGNNDITLYTRASNEARYNITWNECYESDLASDFTPANKSYNPTGNPTLGLTTGCQTLDNVTIKNAESDVTIGSYEAVDEGTRLETQIDVPLGKTYSWYVSLCDQGECYETDVYEFTTGTEPTKSTSSSTTESTSKALDMIIRDEDYNPKGKNTPPTDGLLTEGYINKIEEDSNQLEPNMDTVGGSNYKNEIWYNTEAGEDSADQYAITKYRNWSISNRGEPFPPATSAQTQSSTFYRDTTLRRTSIDDSSVSKAEKVFGNSIPVVARETITRNGDTVAYPGQGVWIDPDDMDRTRNGGSYDLQTASWKSLMDFNMDITGPDSGIAYHNGPGTPLQTTEPNVYIGDIYFKRNNT